MSPRNSTPINGPMAAARTRAVRLGRGSMVLPKRLHITPAHVTAAVVALASLAFVLCAHSGIGVLVIFVGTCLVGIAGQYA